MRMFENVVQLPDDEINGDGRARLLHYEAQADGSGSVAMDLGDVYAKPSRGLYEPHGFVRVPANLKPSGIGGKRAIAVDYSGKCGAPCLVVIADRIAGAKKTVWSWPSEYAQVVLGGVRQWAPEGKAYGDFTQAELRELAGKLGKPAAKKKSEEDDEDVSGSDVRPVIAGNTFTIEKGDATLKGTLVAPAAVVLSGDALEQYKLGAKHTLVRYTSSGVIAPGTGDFLAVITIGKGEAPAVKANGSRVAVGGRQIAWDGEKIAIR
jgi:hypothetical protein